ncbi:MAG: class II fructose-bisphosphate aldolase [Caldilineaceae bacterium]|nr:class II fructose-bisphosphate aldolase [Caldilineaceae bacterium]MBP8109245.1 class II fructose-bisphosphate aldolase [Caldilineaceae bacterium]MBP8122947.1 class II fructose-bisphosphate aldolase [Caldilineaceae bacterium]MBP9073071.1 class II fructose-bisphosphate aldolase [Caldilineaceae bacterium]
MIHESVHEARKNLHGIVAISGDKVEVLDADRLRASAIDTLVRDAVFGGPELMAFSRWLIWELGQALDARPASIHELYMAAGRGEFANSTVPAMNMRFMTYDVVRAALRAALKTDARSIIFEIARSEMGYTEQEPEEFTTVIIAAAIKEGYTGPLFVQGDHFQVKASKFATDPEGAIKEVKDLIRKAIPAGFWNIDIDTSTLVTLEPESLDEQQFHNYMRSAEITALVRELEPAGVTISLGGEIGEVGEKNSTTDELDAYLVNYNKILATYGDNLAGLSKISVQTGTSHGGVVLPDGSIKDVAVDFETLRALGAQARFHGSGGAVQHGASTLPAELFHKFPEVETLEIHLATGFMNIMYDHPMFPADLMARIERHMDTAHADERKAKDTQAQFYYKTRKKVLGAYKTEMWGMDETVKAAIMQSLEDQFVFFYNQLNATNTADIVAKTITPVEIHKPRPVSTKGAGDDLGLAD